MIVSRKTRHDSSFRPKVGGFTLIELLAVIAILAVLVSLVVGVGARLMSKGHHDQTLTTMALLTQALTAYYDSYKEYPPDHDTPSGGTNGWPNAVPGSGTTNATYLPGDGIAVLYMYLTGKHYKDNTCNNGLDLADPVYHGDLSSTACVTVVKSFMDKLPISAVTLPPSPAFLDGFGTPMRYQFVGGKPLLTSAGPDAMFGTTLTDPSVADNIRSDGR